VPIGDISLQGGGLIYLENSHTLGDEMEKEFFDRAKKTGLTDEEARSGFNKNMMSGGMLSDGPKEFSEQYDRCWLVTNYEAGDVVLHLPYTIHSSTINHDPKQVIRLGTDLRFVDSSQPYDEVSCRHLFKHEKEVANSRYRDGRMITGLTTEYKITATGLLCLGMSGPATQVA
jgi:phytanoyl-CoA hydroxylase